MTLQRFTAVPSQVRSAAFVAIAVLMSLAVSVWLTMSAARTLNHEMIEHEIGLAQSAVAAERAKLERLQLDFAWWDEGILHLVLEPDGVWADSIIGSWMTEVHDVVFSAVVSADDRVLLAFRNGKLLDTLQHPVFLQPYAELIAEARADARRKAMAGGKPGPGLASTLIALEEGRLTVVSAATFARDYMSDAPFELEGQPVLIIARLLTPSHIAELGRTLLLHDLHLGNATSEPGFDLTDADGSVIGRLAWTPKLHGDEFIAHSAPAIIVQTLTLAGLVIMVVYNRRVIARHTQALTGKAMELLEANKRLSREIEERIQLENDLRQAKETAEFANRTKSEFLANMSHELRTPLNAIIGFSELLREKETFRLTPEQQASYVKDIHDSGSHLLGIINEILDLSRIDAGAVELDESTITVPTLVDDALRLMRPRILGAGVHVHVAIPESMPYLKADERLLKQILLNLLSNAVKFTPRGGCVRVTGQWSGEGITLRVADNGIGIPRDKLSRVLEPFGQVESGYSKRFSGTGLGLPISKRIAELHGGSLVIDSTPGEGTTVTVHLPGDRVVAHPESSAA